MSSSSVEPDRNHLSGIPVPAGSAGNAVPQDLMRFREAMTGLIRYPAAGAADRDARYGGLPAYSVVYSTTGPEEWRKRPDGGWWTGWQYADQSPVSMPWRGDITGTAVAFVRGSAATVHVTCTYSGSALGATDDLGVANPVPAQWRQPGYPAHGVFQAGSGSTGTWVCTAGGSLYLKRPGLESGASFELSWPVML